eukprot:3941128-Rhodomonas_salina.2
MMWAEHLELSEEEGKPLRACYHLSGTDIAHAPVLRVPSYAVSGTTTTLRTVLTQRVQECGTAVAYASHDTTVCGSETVYAIQP